MKYLVEHTNSRVLGQVINKSENSDIKSWLLEQSEILGVDATTPERVYYILNGRPDVFCQLGHRRVFRPKTKDFGFCNSIDNREFVERTHLQGYAAATHKYGLFYNNVLVAVMSFSKSRYTESGYELIRYCSMHNVVGGASRLFAHFVKTHDPNEIVSYANRCWSDGSLYLKLGFADATENPQNVGYWYVRGTERYHRSSWTKKRLIDMGYADTMTESQIMRSMGFLKVFDCGNSKFTWMRT